MLNVVILAGRLTADPEVKKAQVNGSEVPYCQFTLAVDRPNRGEKQTDFIDCVIWRNQAENLARFKKKGDPVVVEGRLEISSFDDAQGIRRRSAKVQARRVSFLPTGRRAEEEQPAPPEWVTGDDPFALPEDSPF